MNARGEKAMGFSQTTTTHHFRLLSDGGYVQVQANDTADTASRDHIRMHLQEQAKKFAAGEFDAMLSLSPKADWDVAAGDLMVHEAGGRVATREGDLLLYNGEKPHHRSVICAGPQLHARLLARLHDFRPGP